MMKYREPLPIEVISAIFRHIKDKNYLLEASLVSKRWTLPALQLIWHDIECLTDECTL